MGYEAGEFTPFATSEMKILLTLLMLLSPLAYSADTPNGAVSEFTANEELILYTVAGVVLRLPPDYLLT
ncbi:hypothetical protein BSPWISOXPB_4436 [uncultured Gammaproteobacteria bacterium]|nr:hypothetical protein BSPWISOXPB_4436 [uncultured Gammaproteobacteria bacterium]